MERGDEFRDLVAYLLMNLLPGRSSVRQNLDVRAWESMKGGGPDA